jgi:hypothetical protein
MFLHLKSLLRLALIQSRLKIGWSLPSRGVHHDADSRRSSDDGQPPPLCDKPAANPFNASRLRQEHEFQSQPASLARMVSGHTFAPTIAAFVGSDFCIPELHSQPASLHAWYRGSLQMFAANHRGIRRLALGSDSCIQYTRQTCLIRWLPV